MLFENCETTIKFVGQGVHLFATNQNDFLEIATIFYNLATFFDEYCNLILQRYRNSVITTRITDKEIPRTGILNGNQDLEEKFGGSNQLLKIQDSK